MYWCSRGHVGWSGSLYADQFHCMATPVAYPSTCTRAQLTAKDLTNPATGNRKEEIRFLCNLNLHILKYVYTKFHCTIQTTSAVDRWRIKCCRRSLQRWVRSDVALQHICVTVHGHRTGMPRTPEWSCEIGLLRQINIPTHYLGHFP